MSTGRTHLEHVQKIRIVDVAAVPSATLEPWFSKVSAGKFEGGNSYYDTTNPSKLFPIHSSLIILMHAYGDTVSKYSCAFDEVRMK
jgi:hypothetical protein